MCCSCSRSPHSRQHPPPQHYHHTRPAATVSQSSRPQAQGPTRKQQQQQTALSSWAPLGGQTSAMAGFDPTCPVIKNLLLLDSEGRRIAVKYFSPEWWVRARTLRRSALVRACGRVRLRHAAQDDQGHDGPDAGILRGREAPAVAAVPHHGGGRCAVAGPAGLPGRRSTVPSQSAFEKALWNKTSRTNARAEGAWRAAAWPSSGAGGMGGRGVARWGHMGASGVCSVGGRSCDVQPSCHLADACTHARVARHSPFAVCGLITPPNLHDDGTWVSTPCSNTLASSPLRPAPSPACSPS